jgi:rhamnulokinase
MSSDAATVAAVDLGATSGRVVLGRVDSSGITLEEAARFPTGAVRRSDGWHWDFGRIVSAVQAGLEKAALRADRDGFGLDSVGVDSWAVDYGLLRDGRLLHEPFHYRDARTAESVASVRERISDAALFARNGLQFLPFNSLYQLDADRARGALTEADRVLLIPDLIGSILTGQAVAERTNASTTGVLNATSRQWDDELISLLGLGRARFAPLIDPGTEIGPIGAPGGGARGAPLVAVGSHDTASAVAGVPGAEGGFAYISCGTWGLVGLELEHPVLSEAARLARFTNELGVDARVRFLHNVMGLWLLDECVKQWADADGAAVDLPALLAAAETLPENAPLFDADDPVFLPPGDLIGRPPRASCSGGTCRVDADDRGKPRSDIRRDARSRRRVGGARLHGHQSRGRRNAQPDVVPRDRETVGAHRARRPFRGDGARQRAGASAGRGRPARRPRRPARRRRRVVPAARHCADRPRPTPWATGR